MKMNDKDMMMNGLMSIGKTKPTDQEIISLYPAFVKNDGE